MHTEQRDGAAIDRIYIHTNEGPQVPDAAHGLAGYLSRISAGYHAISDDQFNVQCAGDELVVWAQGGDNTHSLSVCLIGYSATTDWQTPYSKAMLENAAHVVARWCQAYKIPVRRVAAGAPPSERGIAGHVDDQCPAAGGHTDPGTRFPWTAFLQQVQDIVAPPIDWEVLRRLAEWQKRCAVTPLRLGDRGQDVKVLNDLLAHHGYKPSPGIGYGTKTVVALAHFKARPALHWRNHDGTKCGGPIALKLLTTK